MKHIFILVNENEDGYAIDFFDRKEMTLIAAQYSNEELSGYKWVLQK